MKITSYILLALSLICNAIAVAQYYREHDTRLAYEAQVVRANEAITKHLRYTAGLKAYNDHLTRQHQRDSTRHVQDSVRLVGYAWAYQLRVSRQPVVVLN